MRKFGYGVVFRWDFRGQIGTEFSPCLVSRPGDTVSDPASIACRRAVSMADASSSFRAVADRQRPSAIPSSEKLIRVCSTPSSPRLKPVATKRHPANRSIPRKPARPITCSAQFQSIFIRKRRCLGRNDYGARKSASLERWRLVYAHNRNLVGARTGFAFTMQEE